MVEDILKIIERIDNFFEVKNHNFDEKYFIILNKCYHIEFVQNIE